MSVIDIDSDIEFLTEKAARRERKSDLNHQDTWCKRQIKQAQPAYIRSKRRRRRAQKAVPRMRLYLERAQIRAGFEDLVSRVTAYVVNLGGEVSGGTLNSIYAKIASDLLAQGLSVSAEQISIAVDMACAIEWLEQQEAEAVVRVPELEPDIAEALAIAA